MNKTLRVILNILLVVAVIAFAISCIDLIFSIQYANREEEDPAQTYAGVFEYKLEHRAYGEVLEDYYSRRLDNFEAPAGYEDMYRVAEYAHDAFMVKVCDGKGDTKKASLYGSRAENIRKELGAYKYTADEVDARLKK